MAMKMDFSNIFKLIAAMSPILLGSLLILASILNQDVRELFI